MVVMSYSWLFFSFLLRSSAISLLPTCSPPHPGAELHPSAQRSIGGPSGLLILDRIDMRKSAFIGCISLYVSFLFCDMNKEV